MAKSTQILQGLYDASGNPVGVFVPLELWKKVSHLVEQVEARERTRNQDRPEPIDDWENLKKFWDFRYPVDMDVTCGECGETTENWQQDEPRKFRLTAANLGGLVSFECRKCGAKIIKRHFKDKIAVETKPRSE